MSRAGLPRPTIQVPSYMYMLKSTNFFLEPMGSAAPKVATKVIDITEVIHNKTVTLLCPAQAYPVPKFR